MISYLPFTAAIYDPSTDMSAAMIGIGACSTLASSMINALGFYFDFGWGAKPEFI